MIHNSPYALESLVLMKAALNMTPPNWNAALKIWEDRIDCAVPVCPGFELQAKDRKTVDAMTGWIVKDLLALAARG